MGGVQDADDGGKDESGDEEVEEEFHGSEL